MPSFKDGKDREWDIAIDALKIVRIREDCDEDFLLNDDEKNNTYDRLVSDPVLLCRVVFLLCEAECSERNVTMESFYMEVVGNAIDRATEAMLAAIVNFTPKRTRVVMETLAHQNKLQQQAVERVMKKISDPAVMDEVMANVERTVEKEIDEVAMRLKSASNLQDLSASLPQG